MVCGVCVVVCVFVVCVYLCGVCMWLCVSCEYLPARQCWVCTHRCWRQAQTRPRPWLWSSASCSSSSGDCHRVSDIPGQQFWLQWDGQTEKFQIKGLTEMSFSENVWWKLVLMRLFSRQELQWDGLIVIPSMRLFDVYVPQLHSSTEFTVTEMVLQKWTSNEMVLK